MLRSLGWEIERQGAAHEIWSNGKGRIPVPRHREIRKGTAQKIIKQAEGHQ